MGLKGLRVARYGDLMRGMKTSTREATRRHGASCWVLRLLASTLYLGYWYPSKQLRVNLFEGKLEDPLHTQKFLETCSQSREDQNLSSGKSRPSFRGYKGNYQSLWP